MYYVLFYGGIVFAVAVFIYAVVYIKNNNICGCIRDIFKFMIWAIILFAPYHDITANNSIIKNIPQNQISYTGNETVVDGDLKRTDTPAVVVSVEGLKEEWSSKDVELKVEITSKNEIVEVSYRLGEKETVLEEYKEGGFIIYVTESEAYSDGMTVNITATDIEGNVGEYTGKVYIDKGKPLIGDYSYIRQSEKIKSR